MQPIPYGKQNITREDVDAVTKVLKADFLTQGPEIDKFEKNFAKYIGVDYAVVVSNGTAALHLAVIALGLQRGEKVITTPITFAASANCVRYCDGEVVFADIEPDSYLIDFDKVEEILSQSKQGEYVGIIPVDFAGRAVDLEKLREIADRYNLWILDDACHSPGGYFVDKNGNKQNCGNGKFADISVFSFHPVKHIAAGEGGMITTNDKTLYEKLLQLRTHGIIRNNDNYKNSVEFSGGADNLYPGWYMEMQTLGYNYRLTDIQAALANSQLQRADEGLRRRIEIAKKYTKEFENKPFIKGLSGLVDGHAYHLYVIEVENRLGLYNHLREKKIFAQIHYIPCHLMPYYREQGWEEGDLPNSENYYKYCISLPMFPTLTDEQQSYVINEINKFYEA